LGWRVYGYLLFIKINSTLAYQGEALVIIPPERPTFDAKRLVPSWLPTTVVRLI
jgi:hypothetical protein